MVQPTLQRATPVRPVTIVAIALMVALALASAGPAAAAPRDGASEPLPVLAALHQVSARLQTAFAHLPDWVGSVWDRLSGDLDPDGATVSAESQSPAGQPVLSGGAALDS